MKAMMIGLTVAVLTASAAVAGTGVDRAKIDARAKEILIEKLGNDYENAVLKNVTKTDFDKVADAVNSVAKSMGIKYEIKIKETISSLDPTMRESTLKAFARLAANMEALKGDASRQSDIADAMFTLRTAAYLDGGSLAKPGGESYKKLLEIIADFPTFSDSERGSYREVLQIFKKKIIDGKGTIDPVDAFDQALIEKFGVEGAKDKKQKLKDCER
jgi:hypothetical protein